MFMTSRQHGAIAVIAIALILLVHGSGYNLTTELGWRRLTDFLPPPHEVNFVAIVLSAFLAGVALILRFGPQEN